MTWRHAVVLGLAATLAALVLAGGDDSYPAVPASIGTPGPIPWPDGEEASAAQIALGRQLFFDPRLSASGTLSCASCHDPAKGLADGLPRSRGVTGNLLTRHTPALVNPAWGTVFFWDGRATSLEQQAMGPITHPQEMGQPRERILPRLQRVRAYREGFAAAYPAGGELPAGLALETLSHAIASFERTLVSRGSAFDRYAAGDRQALDASARRGLALFAGAADCVACHRGPNFTDQSFHNLGHADQGDPGRGAVMAGASLNGAFKTPSLRNVALTAPYLHDGSLATLDEVVAFYDRGGDRSPHDPLVTRLGLSGQERNDLVAFLTALSDPIRVERPALPPDDP